MKVETLGTLSNLIYSYSHIKKKKIFTLITWQAKRGKEQENNKLPEAVEGFLENGHKRKSFKSSSSFSVSARIMGTRFSVLSMTVISTVLGSIASKSPTKKS